MQQCCISMLQSNPSPLHSNDLALTAPQQPRHQHQEQHGIRLHSIHCCCIPVHRGTCGRYVWHTAHRLTDAEDSVAHRTAFKTPSPILHEDPDAQGLQPLTRSLILRSHASPRTVTPVDLNPYGTATVPVTLHRDPVGFESTGVTPKSAV